MNQINKIKTAIELAMQQCRNGECVWNPVFANVHEYGTGKKLGHIVSDGYTHEDWSFYPVSEIRLRTRRGGDTYKELSEQAERLKADPTIKLRRAVKRKSLDAVVPKWVGNHFNLWNIRSYKTEQKVKEARANYQAEADAMDCDGNFPDANLDEFCK